MQQMELFSKSILYLDVFILIIFHFYKLTIMFKCIYSAKMKHTNIHFHTKPLPLPHEHQ